MIIPLIVKNNKCDVAQSGENKEYAYMARYDIA